MRPALDVASPPSFASLVMSRAALDLPDVGHYARAAIVARRVMTLDDHRAFLSDLFDLAEEQLHAHFDVLGEPAGPGDVAFETATRALWLHEILCSEVGDAFMRILPAAVSGPLFAELDARGITA